MSVLQSWSILTELQKTRITALYFYNLPYTFSFQSTLIFFVKQINFLTALRHLPPRVVRGVLKLLQTKLAIQNVIQPAITTLRRLQIPRPENLENARPR